MDLRDIFERFFEGYSKDNLYTSMPAVVMSVNNYGSRQTVDVRPVISKVAASGYVMSNEEITIYEVPIVSPAGGGGLLSFPIKVKDIVWLNFSMRSLEDWQYSEGSSEVVPSDSRHFHQTDAVAFPCIFTSKNNLAPSTDNVELKFKDSIISLKHNGDIDINNASGKINILSNGQVKCSNSGGSYILKSNGDIDLIPSSKVTIVGDLDVTGTVTATTDVIGGGKSLKTHVHICNAVGTPSDMPT